MSDTDSLEYLQAGFDPSTLTVPRLRSILVSHDIDYPSSAKKSQLIQIFNDHVLPQSRRILSARARAKRTSRGIVDAESSQDSTVSPDLDDEDEEALPPPPTPRARSSRKTSTRVKNEESEAEMPVTRSPTKRTSRVTSKHPRASDTETGTDLEGIGHTVRKSRRSEAPTPAPAPLPRMTHVDIDDGAGTSRRESAFTYDNPFQSGSSPPSGLSSERKRKSLGASTSKDLARRRTTSTSTTRRRTDIQPVDDGFHPPTLATFQLPISVPSPPKDVDENGVEASEEFTPEEQMELIHEHAVNGVDALGPRRPRQQKSRGLFKGPLALAVLTILGGYATWYRQEKIAVGYCGIGRDAVPVVPAGMEVPDWARLLVEPECEPCPKNAFCSVDLRSECIIDFVKKPHPLSLGGLVPLPPTCEPDGEKFRKVKAVADKAIEELRDRKAKFECGELVDETGVPETKVEMDVVELKKEVGRKRRKGMSEDEFNDLWSGALGEIEKRDEVKSVVDG
jgi:hypothetical protein